MPQVLFSSGCRCPGGEFDRGVCGGLPWCGREGVAALRSAVLAALLLSSVLVCGQDAPGSRGVTPETPASASVHEPGPYYALVIGNADYKYLNKLQTPVNDAQDVAKLLRERYGFQTQVLLDADRDQIMTALVNYRKTLTEDSSLLIYYAGHGQHDPDADEAYWLPIDAQPDNPVNWISADDITSNLKGIRSAHILIIADSCYSGYIAAHRSGDAGINPEDRSALLQKKLSLKSRTLMSSGGDEPVADSGAPRHSLFAAAVLKGLEQMSEDAFTGGELLYGYVQPVVGGRSKQLPQYDWLESSGHDNGDFVFFRQPSATAPGPASATVTKPDAGAEAAAGNAPGGATRPHPSGAGANKQSGSTNVSAWVVGSTGTILHTADGGLSWSPETSGTTNPIYSVAFATLQSGWAVSFGPIFLHTEDGGGTWASQSFNSAFAFNAIATTKPALIWTAGWNGSLMRSQDGGVSWQFQASGVAQIVLSEIRFVTEQSGWIVGTHGTILHSGDGGENWEEQTSGITTDLHSVAFATPQLGWVVGEDGVILHSGDGGLTWMPQHSITRVSLYSVAFATPVSGWAVGANGIIEHTDDGGATWTLERSGTAENLFAIAFATPQSGWAVGSGGVILHTEDGGLSWKVQSSGTSEELNAIALITQE
jgi:photosystem II stability/assembly factor-like uncharacterized protein/uncharacterized caspase-like protein